MMFKMRFPLLYASTSLETKSLTITSNCDFESCMAIRCLASQHIFRFYHFCRGFFLCFWQLCSLLCRPPQRSLSDRDKTINVSAIVTFPRKSLIHRHWRQEVLLSSWFAVSGGEIISWPGAIVCEPLGGKISHFFLGGIQPL